MAKYILDTNIISYLWDEDSSEHDKIVQHLDNLNDDDIVGMSVVTYYELRYGVDSIPEHLKAIFANALKQIENHPYFQIFSLDYTGADYFSHLKTVYKNHTGISTKANKKNDIDFIIASLVMKENAILISNDGIFETLSNLDANFQYQNWLD